MTVTAHNFLQYVYVFYNLKINEPSYCDAYYWTLRDV